MLMKTSEAPTVLKMISFHHRRKFELTFIFLHFTGRTQMEGSSMRRLVFGLILGVTTFPLYDLGQVLQLPSFLTALKQGQ